MKIISPILLAILCLAFAVSGYANEPVPVAISFVGFYNSESVEFRPKPIGYKNMINFADAHDALQTTFNTNGFAVMPTGDFEKVFQEFSKKDVQQLKTLKTTLLEALNKWLISETRNKPIIADPKFPDLRKYRKQSEWTDESQLYILIGLETRPPGSNGLRSGLAIACFDGSGACKSVSSLDYNFVNYNTDQFIADCTQLIEKNKKL